MTSKISDNYSPSDSLEAYDEKAAYIRHLKKAKKKLRKCKKLCNSIKSSKEDSKKKHSRKKNKKKIRKLKKKLIALNYQKDLDLVKANYQAMFYQLVFQLQSGYQIPQHKTRPMLMLPDQFDKED